MTQYTVDESVVLAALEKDPKIFKEIKKPSSKIISTMVSNHPQWLLSHVKSSKQVYDILLEDFHHFETAIKKNPYNLELLFEIVASSQHIDDETMFTLNMHNKNCNNLFRLALSKNGLTIKFIPNPSEELQMLAIENNPDALLNIEQPTLKAVQRALELKPDLFKKMENIKNAITPDYNDIDKKIRLNILILYRN